MNLYSQEDIIVARVIVPATSIVHGRARREVLMWGSRFFGLDGDGRYRELVVTQVFTPRELEAMK